MRYADKLRLYLLENPAVFTQAGVRAAVPGPMSTVKHALKELANNGELYICEANAHLHLFKYQVTDKLRTPDENVARSGRILPRKPPVAAGARVVRFVEDPQDADPEHGVYYHRPQPAQAAMQPKSGPGMIW